MYTLIYKNSQPIFVKGVGGVRKMTPSEQDLIGVSARE